MAGPYYVRSTDGDDASDGLTWTNAKATLAGALAIAAAGERIWVSQAHAETQASAMTLTTAGTAAAPIEILCGNDAAEPPTALATTATVTTTGTSSMTFIGFASVYGITFNVATGSGNAFLLLMPSAVGRWLFDTCGLNYVGTATSNTRIAAGQSSATRPSQLTVLVNSTISLGHANQSIATRCNWLMFGGAVLAPVAAPSLLVTTIAGSDALIRFRGVDLSAVVSTLADVSNGASHIVFENCKVAAGIALTTGENPGPSGPKVFLDNCDSGDTQYRMQRHSYEGDVYSETTIVRTGGASNGTTGLAHKMVSSANRTFSTPLYGPELVIWNAATGSAKTATVEIVHDSVTNLQDDEAWLEVEYLGTSGFPLSLFASDRMADILATPADQTDSSATWTTTGLTNPNTQKLAVTFTPQEIGVIRCRVAVAKASYTVFVDPLVTVA